LGVGVLGFGPHTPIPNPQSPIPNPQSPLYLFLNLIFGAKKNLFYLKY